MNILVRSIKLSAGAVGILIFLAAGNSAAQTIKFSGYTWTVRSGGYGSPGVNYWSSSNAFVDANGALHLKLNQQGGKWYGAEVVSTNAIGFGTYQFSVIGRVDLLDKNVVLGLFSYPTLAIGADRTNEIDIEFAKWGNTNAKMLNYTAWPVVKSYGPTGVAFPIQLSGTYSTHRYIRSSTSIRFQSTHGFYNTNVYPIADWTYAPSGSLQRLSQSAMPVHINLWAGAAPSNGQPVEVIISAFKYTP